LHIREWVFLGAGSLMAVISFMWDYWNYATTDKIYEIADTVTGDKNIFNDMLHYVPDEFNWPLFLVGEAIILLGIVLFIIRMKKPAFH
jgi:multisubunit Na+/H+ antiporter MnhB subunit